MGLAQIQGNHFLTIYNINSIFTQSASVFNTQYQLDQLSEVALRQSLQELCYPTDILFRPLLIQRRRKERILQTGMLMSVY